MVLGSVKVAGALPPSPERQQIKAIGLSKTFLRLSMRSYQSPAPYTYHALRTSTDLTLLGL